MFANVKRNVPTWWTPSRGFQDSISGYCSALSGNWRRCSSWRNAKLDWFGLPKLREDHLCFWSYKLLSLHNFLSLSLVHLSRNVTQADNLDHDRTLAYVQGCKRVRQDRVEDEGGTKWENINVATSLCRNPSPTSSYTDYRRRIYTSISLSQDCQSESTTTLLKSCAWDSGLSSASGARALQSCWRDVRSFYWWTFSPFWLQSELSAEPVKVSRCWSWIRQEWDSSLLIMSCSGTRGHMPYLCIRYDMQ